MERYKEWIIEWFVDNSAVDKETLEANADVNYFEAGYIDSFVFISLMDDIEEEFGAEFDNDQFLDRSFATINGLANILSEMVK